VALSSAEAELYALTKGAANVLGMISLAADFGMLLHGRVHSDASAALGVVNRTGVGKLRHIRVQFLWIQDQVRLGELVVRKVAGADNQADVFTKNVDAVTLARHIKALGFELQNTRSLSAPTLNYLAMNIEEMIMQGQDINANNLGNVELKNPDSVVGDNVLGLEVNDPGTITPNIIGNDENMSNNIANMLGTWENKPEVKYMKLLNVTANKVDEWHKQGLYVMRCHVKERTQLFTPRRIEGAPPCRTLSGTRVTIGEYADGETFRRVDAWTARSTAHEEMSRPWRGFTIFLIKTA
jgi:hypothetical protein